jgi:hypothetical protein
MRSADGTGPGRVPEPESPSDLSPGGGDGTQKPSVGGSGLLPQGGAVLCAGVQLTIGRRWPRLRT